MARISNNTLVVDSQSMAASFTTSQLSLVHIFGYSITIVVSSASSLDGYFTLEFSNVADPAAPHIGEAATWVTVPGSSQQITADGSITYNVADSFYRFVRVKYVRTAGSGTCDIQLNVKGL